MKGDSSTIIILVGVISTLTSWLGAAFIAGSRWGGISTELKSMNNRLIRIEGMFEMKLKE